MRPTVDTGEERIEDMVSLLLARGASPNRGAGPGLRPLDVAEDAAYADVAKLLRAHGAVRAHR
jgi:ankyrin repeat protein